MQEGIKKSLIIMSIVIGSCIVAMFLILIIGHLTKKKVAQVASDKVLEEMIRESVKEEYRSNNSDGNHKKEKPSKKVIDSEVQKVLDSIDEDDREVIEETIYNHLSAEFVSEAIDYLKDGDIEGLEEAAKDELSDEEIDKLMKIYHKYAKDY